MIPSYAEAASDRLGAGAEGIVIGKEKAEQTISAKAVEAGNEDGEYLYYGRPSMRVDPGRSFHS